jgi:tetratricopeptide (TPR) repeat protein
LDNIRWILPATGLIGVAVTFILGGWLWVVVGVASVLVIVCAALLRTAIHLNGLRLAAEAQLAKTPTDTNATKAESGEANSPTDSLLIERPSGTSDSQESPPAGAPRESSTKPDDTATAKVDQGPEIEAWRAAYVQKDPEEVGRLFAPWIASAEEDQRADREATDAYLRIVAGRHSALAELFNIADAKPDDASVVIWLAMALDFLGEPLRAADEIARRRGAVQGSGRMFLREARLRRRVGQALRALGLARSALAAPEVGPETRATALIEEGYALEELGRRFESFASFEQALEIDPGNADVRFHLAYQYTGANWRQLALTHYQILRAQGRTGMAANNLAVEYHHFSLPILAVESYRAATESSVALAHGNLAVKLIEAGFIDEAMAQISAGEKLEPANRMIANALGRVPSDREAQEKKRDEIARLGQSLREIFVRFDLRAPNELPAGEYVSTDGARLIFSIEGDEAKGAVGDWAAIAKIEQGYVQLSLKKGAILSTTASGHVISRDGELVGYLIDYPAKGDTTPLRASRPPLKSNH